MDTQAQTQWQVDRELVLHPQGRDCRLTVTLPVRDEAERLQDTLAALANQHGAEYGQIGHDAYEVIVLLNNCRDASAQIARRFARTHPDFRLHVLEFDLPPAFSHAGGARKLLMDAAARRFQQTRHPEGIIASTDADTQVSSTWLSGMFLEFSKGADAVSGDIRPLEAELASLPAETQAYLTARREYQELRTELAAVLDPDSFDPWPRHYHHHGASLAVTAQAYAAVGGLPLSETGEDEALFRALRAHDATFRHSPLVEVATSPRASGRASGGFAELVQRWSDMAARGEPIQVGPVADEIVRLNAHRRLREIWQRQQLGLSVRAGQVEAVASAYGVSVRWLQYQLATASTFGRVSLALEDRALPRAQQVPIQHAIQELRQRLDTLRAYQLHYA
ncbi:MAG: glycosyl transferase family 2 [Puniceicoccaceae bacterium 5H]|nr:MAG: glycosyl transferase family 2 [Puniceicoccaceae bacterium 5H]